MLNFSAMAKIDIIEKIRKRQRNSRVSHSDMPPEHKPEILYIGCIDARLAINSDIGIPEGKASIVRNIGALVPKYRDDSKPSHDNNIAATLELFINILPQAEKGVKKHIVVSGHTDCGGIRTCYHGTSDAKNPQLSRYLDSRLHDVLERVKKKAAAKKWDDARTLRELEKESVRQSLDNLMEYPIVQKAVKDGKIEVHGWVLNTATHRIAEMDPETLEFTEMTKS